MIDSHRLELMANSGASGSYGLAQVAGALKSLPVESSVSFKG
jgi:hypothetical protein